MKKKTNAKSYQEPGVSALNETIDLENNITISSSLKIGKNRDVWFTFKFIEMIIGIVCLAYHVRGAVNSDEPQPHAVYFCGTFVAFTIINILTQIRMLLGATIPPILESLIAVVACAAFYFAAFASMYHAENDFHLMYLTDNEEANHRFFYLCRAQSISSLVCASVYLLNAVYAIDSVVIRDKPAADKSDDEASANHLNGPIELRLWFRPWLEKIKFFRLLYARIETLEAVAYWKRSQYKKLVNDVDADLAPGINIYAFEEPVKENRSEMTKMKKKSKLFIEMELANDDDIKVGHKQMADKGIQVTQEDFDDAQEEVVLSSDTASKKNE